MRCKAVSWLDPALDVRVSSLASVIVVPHDPIHCFISPFVASEGLLNSHTVPGLSPNYIREADISLDFRVTSPGERELV